LFTRSPCGISSQLEFARRGSPAQVTSGNGSEGGLSSLSIVGPTLQTEVKARHPDFKSTSRILCCPFRVSCLRIGDLWRCPRVTRLMVHIRPPENNVKGKQSNRPKQSFQNNTGPGSSRSTLVLTWKTLYFHLNLLQYIFLSQCALSNTTPPTLEHLGTRLRDHGSTGSLRQHR
jgi:hypothetical protein